MDETKKYYKCDKCDKMVEELNVIEIRFTYGLCEKCYNEIKEKYDEWLENGRE